MPCSLLSHLFELALYLSENAFLVKGGEDKKTHKAKKPMKMFRVLRKPNPSPLPSSKGLKHVKPFESLPLEMFLTIFSQPPVAHQA